MAEAGPIVQACVARLRELEPVRQVVLERGPMADRITLVTPLGRLPYRYTVKRSLTRPRLDHMLIGFDQQKSRARGQPRQMILADALAGSVADRLEEADVDFVDAAGNMVVRWPGKLHVRIRGVRAPRAAEATATLLTTPAGLGVAFTLLTATGEEVPPYREIARASDVSLAAVARVAGELRRRGHLVVRGRHGRFLRRRAELLEVWVGGYAERLRPRLVLGRFRSQERDLVRVLEGFGARARGEGVAWAVTGGFAADHLTGHYQGDQLVLFVDSWTPEIATALRWLPSAEGPVTVLRPFTRQIVQAPLVTPGARIAHPLLVYAELLFQGGERDIETARLIREQHLARLARDASA